MIFCKSKPIFDFKDNIDSFLSQTSRRLKEQDRIVNAAKLDSWNLPLSGAIS